MDILKISRKTSTCQKIKLIFFNCVSESTFIPYPTIVNSFFSLYVCINILITRTSYDDQNYRVYVFVVVIMLTTALRFPDHDMSPTNNTQRVRKYPPIFNLSGHQQSIQQFHISRLSKVYLIFTIAWQTPFTVI